VHKTSPRKLDAVAVLTARLLPAPLSYSVGGAAISDCRVALQTRQIRSFTGVSLADCRGDGGRPAGARRGAPASDDRGVQATLACGHGRGVDALPITRLRYAKATGQGECVTSWRLQPRGGATRGQRRAS